MVMTAELKTNCMKLAQRKALNLYLNIIFILKIVIRYAWFVYWLLNVDKIVMYSSNPHFCFFLFVVVVLISLPLLCISIFSLCLTSEIQCGSRLNLLLLDCPPLNSIMTKLCLFSSVWVLVILVYVLLFVVLSAF